MKNKKPTSKKKDGYTTGIWVSTENLPLHERILKQAATWRRSFNYTILELATIGLNKVEEDEKRQRPVA